MSSGSDGGRRRRDSGRILLEGTPAGVHRWDITNPKSIVFFVAALPRFVDLNAGSVPAQMMVLGLVFTVIAFACDATWALLAGSVRQWFASSPKRTAAVRASGGGMMIGLGGVLAFTGPKA